MPNLLNLLPHLPGCLPLATQEPLPHPNSSKAELHLFLRDWAYKDTGLVFGSWWMFPLPSTLRGYKFVTL